MTFTKVRCLIEYLKSKKNIDMTTNKKEWRFMKCLINLNIKS